MMGKPTVTVAVVCGVILVAGCILCAFADYRRQQMTRHHGFDFDDGPRGGRGIRGIRVDKSMACRVGVASSTNAEASRMPSLIGDDEEKFFQV